MLKPLFKWTGGKNRMFKKYGANFWPDREVNLFVDSFYGGGAVTHWAAEKYPNAEFIINDANTELVNLYKQLRDNTEACCDAVQKMEEAYLKVPADDKLSRKKFYNKYKMLYIDWVHESPRDHTVDEFATLYFLMKTSFNGWWKVYNYSKGRYSTPPGTVHHTKPFIDYDLLKDTAHFFRERVRDIFNKDFQTVLPKTDLETTYFYFDPPYRDSSTIYTDDGFDDNDQIRLCEFMQYLSTHNAMVSMSNKEIGDGFWRHHLGNMETLVYDVKYTAGRGTTVNNVCEVLIRNFETEKVGLESLFNETN